MSIPATFFDVGWGSDVARCREALPHAFFSLRLSPVRMLQCSPSEIAQDTEKLLLAAGPLEQAGVCCINMDYGTPDENIFAMFEVVQRYRKLGTFGQVGRVICHTFSVTFATYQMPENAVFYKGLRGQTPWLLEPLTQSS